MKIIHQKGFTLIEILVTMTVLAILAVIAVPSFNNLIAKSQLNTAARELADVFGKARGQAIGFHRDVTIKLECPKNSDGVEVCPADQPFVLHWMSSRANISLIGDRQDVIYTATGIAKQRKKEIDNPNYDPNANTDLSANPPVNPPKIDMIVPLTFNVCHSALGEQRTVFVSSTGTIERIEKGVC